MADSPPDPKSYEPNSPVDRRKAVSDAWSESKSGGTSWRFVFASLVSQGWRGVDFIY